MSNIKFASDMNKEQVDSLIEHLVNWRERSHFHSESSILDDLYYEFAQELVDGIYEIIGHYQDYEDYE